MIAGDPNVRSVELVAAALGDLCDEVVLVGGCAASLLIDAPTAPPPRVTYDVDLIAVVAALRDYHALEERFAERGFKRDFSAGAPICRWRIGAIEVDLMPTDEKVLGFTNRWYAEAAATATRLALANGASINLISAPAFLATKFEAFRLRGQADLLQSHDFEDIVNVLDGRPGIETEVAAAPAELSAYLAMRFRAVLDHPDFSNTLPGLVVFDELYDARIAAVLRRATAIANLKNP